MLLDRAEALKEARGPFELSDFVAFAQCLMDAAEADEDHQSAFYRFFIVGKLFDVVVHFSDSEEHAKAKRYAQFMSLKRRKQHLGEVAPESQPSVEGSSSNGAEENERRLDAKGESDESGDEEPKSVAPTRAPLVNSGSPELQEEAIKHAKSAVSALSFEDFGTAAAHLRAALDVLGRMGF
ncbi:vacuolar protein sorting-associated protein VTA1 [Babesia caballi]|uniref:Vacuolar protein sorting-associated protein VTA1 n=1 Tax=Babesia caballi TaxID=5871 RepID=A0AAV4LYT5_BABCB|nr:vacuolar protein sorting-associated protein VTA1 [Babesia caballi]